LTIKKLWNLVTCASAHWMSDGASTLGAALAFYCAFSLAPLLVLVVTTAGWIVGAEAAYSYVGQQLRSLFGSGTANVLIEAARNSQTDGGMIATVISIITLLIGATTIFSALQSALHRIWGVETLAPSGIRGFVRSRLLSLGFVLALGFLLLISLTLSTALTALQSMVAPRLAAWAILACVLDLVFSTALATALFALTYRYMPAKRVAWRLVTGGALVTAVLFQLGRWAIGLYLGTSTQPSAFGAAASFVALLLWLYYSAQIFLFGAEFTSCLANLRPPQQADEAAKDRPPKSHVGGARKSG